MTGIVGRIDWGYYRAAAINGYTVSRSGTGWSLHGTVVLADAYKVAQRPLTFVALLRWEGRDIEWRWPIVGMNLQGGVVTAQLGAPEEVSHGATVAVRSA